MTYNDAKITNKIEEQEQKIKLAGFYTNASYLVMDVAYTFACDCDVILNSLHKCFMQNEKRKIKNALLCADRLRHSLRDVLSPYKDILQREMAVDDSDYMYNVIKLIFDRTSDTAEGKDLVLDKIRELPSIMKMEQGLYIDYKADLEEVGETELQKQMNKMQDEYSKIASKYREALAEAKKVAMSRLLLEQYENKRIEVDFTINGVEKKQIGFYGGCKIVDGSNNIYMMLYDITKDGRPSRRSPRNIKVTNIKKITKNEN